MRIPCPFCGPRDSGEFSYLGDASPRRPDTANSDTGIDAAMYDYVYLRENRAGAISEYWFHDAGCHGWLVVERDTRTHYILGATVVNGEGQA